MLQKVAALRRQESAELKKQSFWIIRQTDEMVIRTHDTIDRTMQRINIRRGSPVEPTVSPAEEWGERLMSALEHPRSALDHPKRRADD